MKAAEELGYTPNAWARTLRSSSGGFVGIIVADFHNPLFTDIAEAARQLLASQGIFSFVSTASLVDGPDGKIVDPEPIHHLLDLKPSSLFIVGGLPEHGAFTNLPSGMPIVVALASATNIPTAVTVRTDETVAMHMLCSHLHDLGHHVVAYVGPEGRPVTEARRDAFVEQATIEGFEFSVVSSGRDIDERGGLEAAQVALDQSPRPTAIVCFNDIVAFGTQSAILRASEGGAPDVAVTGFDNTYIAQLDRIDLTTVSQDVAAIARESCAVLTDPDTFAAVSGTEIFVAPELIVRSSTTAVPV